MARDSLTENLFIANDFQKNSQRSFAAHPATTYPASYSTAIPYIDFWDHSSLQQTQHRNTNPPELPYITHPSHPSKPPFQHFSSSSDGHMASIGVSHLHWRCSSRTYSLIRWFGLLLSGFPEFFW